MTDLRKLLPCPFCHSLAAMHSAPVFGGDHGFRIECEGICHAMTCYWHTEKQAVSAWNRRAALAEPESQPVAWIEHHKGGDNLNWEPVNHPYAKATPLYAQPKAAATEPDADQPNVAPLASTIKWKRTPLNPTPEMKRRGGRRLLQFQDGSTDESFSPLQWFAVSNEAERVWRSMWLTAPEGVGQEDGWVPTTEMMHAGYKRRLELEKLGSKSIDCYECGEIFKAMLAAHDTGRKP